MNPAGEKMQYTKLKEKRYRDNGHKIHEGFKDANMPAIITMDGGSHLVIGFDQRGVAIGAVGYVLTIRINQEKVFHSHPFLCLTEYD
jgi:hypothetical protein